MTTEITDEIREKAWELYTKNNTIRDIAIILETSYLSTWILTSGRKKGYNSISEYKKHLARQKGYKSSREYEEHLALKNRKIKIKFSFIIKKRLYELDKSQTWLAKKLEVSNSAIYRYISGYGIPKENLRKRMFKVLGIPYQTLDDINKIKGPIHKSRLGYYNKNQDHNSVNRNLKEFNIGFGDIITTRLSKLEKSQTWLAREIGVTDSTISLYISGQTMPREFRRLKILKILKISHKTLDDLIESCSD